MNGIFYDFVLKPIESIHLTHLRDDLLIHAKGKTLEIGAGTGLNFSHYPEGLEVNATDIDPDMMKVAKKRGDHSNIRVEEADVENLPYPDQEFDTVVATLVLCSVTHPKRALSEVYRVLKPGGKLLLMEHVRKNTPVIGKMQDTLTPIWKHVAGNCHLNRDPELTLKELGLKTLSKKVIWKGLGKIWELQK